MLFTRLAYLPPCTHPSLYQSTMSIVLVSTTMFSTVCNNSVIDFPGTVAVNTSTRVEDKKNVAHNNPNPSYL